MSYPICLHESGHAVCALDLGYQVTSVELTPERGLTKVREPRWKDDDQLRDRLTIAVAGRIAESIAGYDPPDEYGDGDADIIRRVLYDIRDTDFMELDRAERRAKRILVRRWQQVENLAAALLDRERLTSNEISEAIDTKPFRWLD